MRNTIHLFSIWEQLILALAGLAFFFWWVIYVTLLNTWFLFDVLPFKGASVWIGILSGFMVILLLIYAAFLHRTIRPGMDVEKHLSRCTIRILSFCLLGSIPALALLSLPFLSVSTMQQVSESKWHELGLIITVIGFGSALFPIIGLGASRKLIAELMYVPVIPPPSEMMVSKIVSTSLIVSALTDGALVKTAYEKLSGALNIKLRSMPKVNVQDEILGSFKENPKINQAGLAADLKRVRAHEDEEIIALAYELLQFFVLPNNSIEAQEPGAQKERRKHNPKTKETR